MRRLARCLLMLALPFGGLAVAAPAGGGAKKATAKSSEKTPAKAKAKPAPKSTDEEENKKAPSTKPKPADEAEATLPAPKRSSKAVTKTNADGDEPRKAKTDTTAKNKTSGDRRTSPAVKPKPAAKRDTDEPEKKAETGSKAGESSAGTAKAKGKTSSNETAKKTATKPKSKTPIDEGDERDKADTGAKADSTTKAKSKSAPETALKKPIDNAGDPAVERTRVTGPNATLATSEIANFSANSIAVQNLLRLGLELAERDLTYRYGSADPSTGGMDCSGTVYYLLRAAGVKEVPRDSSGLYLWAQEAGTLRTVRASSLDDPQFAALRPGDLLFWEGTYVVRRDPPISHSMIYLGREKATGSPIMVGASDGRSFRGIRRNGVSVFDFKLPKADSTARFVGYARVPGLE